MIISDIESVCDQLISTAIFQFNKFHILMLLSLDSRFSCYICKVYVDANILYYFFMLGVFQFGVH